MAAAEQDTNKLDSLRERSVSWSDGLSAIKDDNTEAAKRLRMLIAQSQEQVAPALVNQIPGSVVDQAAEERHKADFERLVAVANSQQRLLQARLRATRDEADRYRRDLDEVRGGGNRNVPTRTSMSLCDLQAAGFGKANQHSSNLTKGQPGRGAYQPSMPILPSGDQPFFGFGHQPSFGSQFSVPFSNLNAQLSAELLNKERDDLLAVNQQLRARLERYAAREREITEQMKHALELGNRMQLERADAMVRASRAEEELANVRRAFEEQLADTQRASAIERASFAIALERAGDPNANAELNSRVRELEEGLAITSLKNERLTEENRTLRDDLSRRVAAAREFEDRAARIREELAASVTRASTLRDAAQQDASRLQRAYERVSEQLENERANHERVRSTQEAMLKRAEAQYDALRSYAMHVAELARNNERRADEAVSDRDHIVSAHAEQLAAVATERDSREKELLASVQHYQTRYETAAREMTTLADQQNSLISKLKNECSTLHAAVERITNLKEETVSQVQLERDELSIKYERMRTLCHDLESQNRQFQRTNDELRERVLELERRAQTSTLISAAAMLHQSNASLDATHWNDTERVNERRPVTNELTSAAF